MQINKLLDDASLRRLQKSKTYKNAREGLDINAPVVEMKEAHKKARSDLNNVVTQIQKAHDEAKKNNTEANVLLGEEKKSLASVHASMNVLNAMKKTTDVIRKDKKANFPALPADNKKPVDNKTKK